MSSLFSCKLAHGETVLGAGVNDREIELLIVRFQLDEKIEDQIEHLVRPRVFAVDLVDDDDRLGLVLERFAQNETRLRLRAIVRVDDQQHAVDHLHDALDFAAEIGVAGRVDDVDAITVPLERGVLGADGDALFALEIHRVHHALLDFLVGAKRAGLPQQLIDQRGLAVVDVRDDGDVTDLIHERESYPALVGAEEGAAISCVIASGQLGPSSDVRRRAANNRPAPTRARASVDGSGT